MEGLTRLVSESLARHGFDRPLDYRRLHWSRWFRCESHHSLLFVPSKPGVFAIAEEIMDLGTSHGSADAVVRSVGQSAASVPRRMLAVTQFFEDDDMAFVLDRMLSHQNPMRARLITGRYFVRFVVVEDQTQRRSIWSALNQWIASATEQSTGIGSHFASSLELTPATEYIPPVDERQQNLFHTNENNKEVAQNATDAHVGPTLVSASAHTTEIHLVPPPVLSEAASDTIYARAGNDSTIPAAAHIAAPQLDSGAATNIHCPSPFPSGF